MRLPAQALPAVTGLPAPTRPTATPAAEEAQR